MKDFDWTVGAMVFVTIMVISLLFGAIMYTEHAKLECIKQSLEHKLTVTEIQVLCEH